MCVVFYGSRICFLFRGFRCVCVSFAARSRFSFSRRSFRNNVTQRLLTGELYRICISLPPQVLISPFSPGESTSVVRGVPRLTYRLDLEENSLTITSSPRSVAISSIPVCPWFESLLSGSGEIRIATRASAPSPTCSVMDSGNSPMSVASCLSSDGTPFTSGENPNPSKTQSKRLLLEGPRGLIWWAWATMASTNVNPLAGPLKLLVIVMDYDVVFSVAEVLRIPVGSP